MIIALTGGKGGPGTTVFAVGVAQALCAAGHEVIIADLDPFGGDVGIHLDTSVVDPQRGLLPLLKLSSEEPDAPRMARELTEIAPRLHLLAGLPHPAPHLLSGRAPAILDAVADLAVVVVADLGPCLPGSPSLEVSKRATHVLVCAAPDPQGAVSARRALAVLEEETARVVCTRVRWRADVAELEEVLGRHALGAVPQVRTLGFPPWRARRFKRATDSVVDALVSSMNGRMEAAREVST